MAKNTERLGGAIALCFLSACGSLQPPLRAIDEAIVNDLRPGDTRDFELEGYPGVHVSQTSISVSCTGPAGRFARISGLPPDGTLGLELQTDAGMHTIRPYDLEDLDGTFVAYCAGLIDLEHIPEPEQ